MGSSVNCTQTGNQYMDSTVGQWKLCKIQFRAKHPKRSSKNYRLIFFNVAYTHSQRVGHDWATRRRQWHPTPVLLPGKSHGRRSLVGCCPWGRGESDRTQQLPFYFSLSCIGEGNGNSLQCSCLENPKDCGAWWAAVNGVAQSWTRLKRLSSSSSSRATKHSTYTHET